MKTCENCKTEHNGDYGSGRFCSTKCSRGFSTKANRKEISMKVSEALKGSGNGNVKLTCKNCEVEFEVDWSKRNQKTCSNKCGKELTWKNVDYRSKMSKINSRIALERHKNGDESFGWKTRNNLQPSYPESIAMRVLDSLNIEYEHEMPFEKYYVDFAIHSRKIAIEIDGQQHNKAERKSTDDLKDMLLEKSGWKVFRIKWPTDNIIESIENIFK